MKRIAIVGGGISGVTAAWQLARAREQGAQIEFVVFEASARIGGIVETQRRDGFVIECGPDSWVTEKPWARELAVELGLEGEIIASNDAARRTYLLRGDQLVALPDGMRMMVPMEMGAIEESPLFSAAARAVYRSEPGRAKELKASAPGRDESVASFVRRHFGAEATETIAGPLLAGVFGGDIEQLSVRAVMPAFVAMEREHGSLIVALRQRKSSGQTREAVFTTLRFGLQTLVDRMAAALPQDSVRLHATVRGLVPAREGWRVSTPGGEERFDAVVLATPAHETRELLERVDSAASALLAMEASSAIVVALAYEPEAARQLRVPKGFGYLVPDKAQEGARESLLACTFVDQKFDDRVPEGSALLRAFFGGEAAPALLSETDEQLVSRATEQLGIALGTMPQPSFSVVRRWPRSLPQYRVGHLERMVEVEKRIAQLPGLRLVGNAYHGVGLPDLIRDARETARVLVEAAQ